MSNKLRAFYAEHDSIAAVLHALQYLADELDRGRKVDAKVFRQILYYLDVFPERFHHPHEDRLLFPALKARTNEADAIIARLEKQHENGAGRIRALEQALLRWEVGGEPERAAFVDATRDFVAGYRAHIRLEEDELMPIARRALTDEDWQRIEAGFGEQRDPLQGTAPDADPVELFRRILYIVPPPIGLGSPAA
ncbi:MAG: hemerythrin domain-containing protein [Burkholderiaceae bacterium]